MTHQKDFTPAGRAQQDTTTFSRNMMQVGRDLLAMFAHIKLLAIQSLSLEVLSLLLWQATMPEFSSL
jgi:hypothetical protein